MVTVTARFAIQLTKPKAPSEKTWIRVSKDTGFVYVNVGHHGRFYAELSQKVIGVAKTTTGAYKVTYTGPWETKQGKLVGKAVTKTFYFTLTPRDRAAFEKVFDLSGP